MNPSAQWICWNCRPRTQMWWLTEGLSQVLSTRQSCSATSASIFSLLYRWWRRYDLPERPWGGRRGSLESKPWVQLPCSQLWQQCLLPVAQVGYEGWQRLLLLKLNLVLSVKRLAVPGRPLMTTPSLWISSLPQIFLSNTIPKRMYWA